MKTCDRSCGELSYPRHCSNPIPARIIPQFLQDVGKDNDENGDDEGSDGENNDGEGKTYEVDFIVGVKMGKHPKGKEKGKKAEHLFKVRWKNFDESEDTWEPFNHLNGQRIRENSLSSFTYIYSDSLHTLPCNPLCVLISYFALSNIQ